MNHAPIDRKALVSRHNIRPADITRVIPLGNGETCFGCDRTGLQTFGGNALAHWAWHSFPAPESVDLPTWPETGSFMQGRLTGTGQDIFPKDRWDGVEYTFDNPHSVNLGRLAFVHLLFFWRQDRFRHRLCPPGAACPVRENRRRRKPGHCPGLPLRQH